MTIEALSVLAGSLLLAAGVFLLRRRWLSRRSRGGTVIVAVGWLLIAAGIAAFVHGWGGEAGTAFALLALSAAGYAAVLATIEVRSGQRREPRVQLLQAGATDRDTRELALEPEDRPTNWPRAIAKSLLAIVLAGIASIGLGVAFAVAMPMSPPDRIILGGLLVPVLWGGGMAWTLCDAKLGRATLVLLAVSAVGYGIAFLPKVL